MKRIRRKGENPQPIRGERDEWTATSLFCYNAEESERFGYTGENDGFFYVYIGRLYDAPFLMIIYGQDSEGREREYEFSGGRPDESAMAYVQWGGTEAIPVLESGEYIVYQFMDISVSEDGKTASYVSLMRCEWSKCEIVWPEAGEAEGAA